MTLDHPDPQPTQSPAGPASADPSTPGQTTAEPSQPGILPADAQAEPSGPPQNTSQPTGTALSSTASTQPTPDKLLVLLPDAPTEASMSDGDVRADPLNEDTNALD